LGFAFDAPDEAWLQHLRAAEAPVTLGHIGDFELIEEVSRGGQGIVFRARQPRTGRDIALKRMIAGSFSSSSARARFEREVEAAAALNHPGIVTVYGMEIVDELPLYAMEWVDGEQITDWSVERSRAPRALLECFALVCDAVQHAHSRGVLHRDLKPSNILVDADGQPHVLDFGLAKRIDTEALEDGEQLTLSEDFVGTPQYAAPEQFGGAGELDARTDVYSLGVVLFELLTGRLPFERRGSVTELLLAIQRETPPLPSSLEPRLGREIDTIVRTAMAREVHERYASVEALAADVRRYLAGVPIQALPPSNFYLVSKLVRRNQAAAAMIVSVFVLGTAYVVNVMRFNSSLSEANSELTTTNKQLTDTIRERDAALRDKERAEGSLGEVRAERDDALFEAELKAGNLADYQILLPPCLDPVRTASKNPEFVARDYSDDGLWDAPAVEPVEQ